MKGNFPDLEQKEEQANPTAKETREEKNEEGTAVVTLGVQKNEREA